MSSPDPPDSPAAREPLTRRRIVAAAIAVLDAEGLAALTMRRVARELDAGAMSIYRHVAGRDELLDLVLDELASTIPATPLVGSWRADAAELARGVRRALLRRRDLTLLLTARLGRGPGALAGLDRSLGVFLRAGFSPRQAVLANHALGAYVCGSCTWEAVGLDGQADPVARAARAREASAFLAGLPPGAFPYLGAVAGELYAGTADERFEHGLAALLDGFAEGLGLGPSPAEGLSAGRRNRAPTRGGG